MSPPAPEVARPSTGWPKLMGKLPDPPREILADPPPLDLHGLVRVGGGVRGQHDVVQPADVGLQALDELGRERKDHRDMMKPMQSYLLCKELHDEFVREYGSCRCHDIQQKIMGRTYDLLDPKQLEEAMKEGMLEHCAGVVGRTTRRAAELILRERSLEAIRSQSSG